MAENGLEGETTAQNWSRHPQNDVLCPLETPVTVTVLPGSQVLCTGLAEVSGSCLT